MIDFVCVDIKPLLDDSISSITKDMDDKRIDMINIINDIYHKAECGMLEPSDVLVLQQHLPTGDNTTKIIGCIVEKYRRFAHQQCLSYEQKLEKSLADIASARDVLAYVRKHVVSETIRVLDIAHMGAMSAEDTDVLRYQYGYRFREGQLDIVIQCLQQINDIELRYSKIMDVRSPDNNPKKWSRR